MQFIARRQPGPRDPRPADVRAARQRSGARHPRARAPRPRRARGMPVDNDEPLVVDGVGNSFEGNIVITGAALRGHRRRRLRCPTIAGWTRRSCSRSRTPSTCTDVQPGDYVVIARTDDPSGQGRFHTRQPSHHGRGLSRPRISPAPVRASRALTAATPAVDVRSTSSPRRTVTAPAASKAASSSGAMPPSGPTTTTISPSVGDVERRQRGRSRPRGARRRGRPSATQARRRRSVDASGVDRRQPRAARLLAGLAGGGLPLGVRLGGTLALPDRDRAGRRPTGTIRVDADLGEHLDGELAAVALGQRLHDGEGRRRPRRRRPTDVTVDGEDPLPGRRRPRRPPSGRRRR